MLIVLGSFPTIITVVVGATVLFVPLRYLVVSSTLVDLGINLSVSGQTRLVIIVPAAFVTVDSSQSFFVCNSHTKVGHTRGRALVLVLVFVRPVTLYEIVATGKASTHAVGYIKVVAVIVEVSAALPL